MPNALYTFANLMSLGMGVVWMIASIKQEETIKQFYLAFITLSYVIIGQLAKLNGGGKNGKQS